MPQKQLSPEIRQMAELLHAETVGRLYACEHLESESERIEDPHVLYGWSLLTQEVLLRLGEASLKLLYLLHFNKPSKRGHSLIDLWTQLPKVVQDQVEAKRRNSPGVERPVSFPQYDKDDFHNVRYFYENLAGGQTIKFETRHLFIDSLAVRDVAEEWIGEIAIWPWAGIVSTDLVGYKILPISDGIYDVLIDDPIEPMDWSGATIEVKDERYVWTLYCGFTDELGELISFRIPSLLYPWPINELLTHSVSESAEQIYRAYQEPCSALLKAIELAKNTKQSTGCKYQ